MALKSSPLCWLITGICLNSLLVACSGSDGSDAAESLGGATTASGGATSSSSTPGGLGGVVNGQGGTVINSAAGGKSSVGGGSASLGGATSEGGTTAVGGVASVGGTTAKGGTTSTGGTTAKGGTTSTGGTTAKGGTTSTGGTTAKGGTTSTGGTTTTGADQCKPIGWATRASRTGGAFSVTGGGNATPIVVKTFAELQTYASDSQARVIHIDGTLGNGWSGESGDRLSIKSNKTIVGLRPGTQLKAAISISSASNVILRNIVVKGPGSDGKQSWDNINIAGSSKNVWVDHCEFWDGQDGNADVVKGADTVTFTWTIFGYTKNGPHNFSNLVASSDSEPASVGKLDITLMFNWFKGVAQRGPRCRFGNIHVVNNLYSSGGLTSDYGISAGLDCKVRTENNHFIGINTPIYTSHKAGTSGHEVINNIFDGGSGNKTGYGTAFTPPYEYAGFMVPAAQVKALVEAKAGATLASPTSCGQ